jgi:glycine oxidase
MENCLIVGGGLIGMLTAKELVEAGVQVTLIDKGVVGKESSWAGGGILSPLYPWRYDDAITRLANWSQQHYPALCKQLIEETAIDPQLTVSGLLMLEVEDVNDAKAWAGRFGYQLDSLTGSDVKFAEPILSGDYGAALNMPAVGQVRNPRILAALRKWLELNKVVILEHQGVSSIWQENHQIRGVMLDGKSIATDQLIIAGGAWSAGVLKSAGIDVNVFPVQGQMLLFKAEPGLIKHIIMREGFYLIPRQDGRVLAGSTVEYRGFDKRTTEDAYNQLKKAALSLVPKLAQYQIEKHWAGLRPGTEKGIPFIGAAPETEGLYVNCGHFRNGVVMGPASARLLADIVLQRQLTIDPNPYCLLK